MTTLEKIKAEFISRYPKNYANEPELGGRSCVFSLNDVSQIIDKYAEQEPTDEWQNGYDMAWEEAEVFYEQEPCDDVVSREAVVDDFIEWREKLEYTVGEDYSGVHLLNVAIQKIWDMPSVTQKPIECDDAVSRQAVKDLFCRICMENNICYRSKDTCEDLKLFNQLPSVRSQESKTGRWIKHDTGHSVYYDCSRCGCIAPCTETADAWLWKLSKYCPDCGAKMIASQESDIEELTHGNGELPNGGWVPLTTRPMTEEEQEHYRE